MRTLIMALACGVLLTTAALAQPKVYRPAAPALPPDSPSICDSPTTTIETFHLEFWLTNPVGGSPTYFEVQWNGQTLMSLTDSATFDWTLYTFGPLVGGDGESVLTFIFRHDPDWWYFDDVDVEVN